ncbi:MAG: zinc-binding dehydrogenase [Planctomycetia bacterium]|nr:zinc-binding dehydrogenase [Planctomycetia bacterium]
MKSLAAILVEQRKPLVIEEIEVPSPKLGQVLVKVLTSGICGSQIGEINGVKGPDRFLPHLLGHEGCGEVLEVGEGVRTVKPGDRVVLHWRKGAGLESVTPVYESRIGKVNAGWVTTFNEYAIVSENRVTAIPTDFDPEIAALFGCAVTTGFGVVNNNAQLAIGQSIAVFGAGGIGLNIVQGAALAGANPIIAIDLFDNRLKLARSLGATHTINSAKADAAEKIKQVVGSDGVDVAVDNTGNVDVIALASRLTGPRGRTVLVGVPPKDSVAAISTLPLHFEKRLVGSHGGECRPEIDIPRYTRLCLDGKLSLEILIGKRYSLLDINIAIEEMLIGQLAGRAIILS